MFLLLVKLKYLLKYVTFFKMFIASADVFSFANKKFSPMHRIRAAEFPGYHFHTLATVGTDFYVNVTLTQNFLRG